jgi:DNA-binding transcriptional LysR family regulator
MPWDARVRRRLKLRDLDTLLAVVQWGSMAKAAFHLSISQPAVSRAVADMEHALGVKLLDRVAQGVEPTLYGRALLKSAVAMFDDMRQGVAEIDFLVDPTFGELRIGATEPMIAGLLPAVLERLCSRYPRFTFHVTQAAGIAQLHQELRSRNIDVLLGRVARPDTHDDLATEVLFDEPSFVVAGPNNRWVRSRKVKLSQLADEPWTLPRPDTIVGTYVRETFRANGLEPPRTAVICNSVQMHNALLAGGRFLSLYSRSMLQFATDHLSIRTLPIQLPRQPTPIGVVTLKGRTISPVAKRFIDCVREVSRPLVGGQRSPQAGKTRR